MKIQNVEKPLSRSTFGEDRKNADSSYSYKELKSLESKYNKVLGELCVADRLVSLAETYVKGYPAVKPAKLPKLNSTAGSPETAVLVLNDTHIGKRICPKQTLGFGHYNFKVFCDRLFFVEQTVTALLADRIKPTPQELVILLLGDMLDGSLAHAKEITSAMTLFDQFYAGSHCLAQSIMRLAGLVKKVRIYTAVGNHTRMPNQKKMPTEQRYSNFDHFLYAMIKALLANQPNIDFHLDTQPFCYFDAQGTKILGMHGDHLKGGDRQMQIPVHAIARQVSGLAQLYESRGMAAPHLWVMGHLHKPIQLPTIKGEWLINGAFPGDDNYALTLATSCEPMQLFFGVHPRYGKSWEYKLKLRHATPMPQLPYTLPTGLGDFQSS